MNGDYNRERRAPGRTEKLCPIRKKVGWWRSLFCGAPRCRLVETHDPPHEHVVREEVHPDDPILGYKRYGTRLILEKWDD